MEILLHQAADFVPAENAPEGLAERALARWESAGRTCSAGRRRNFVPAISLGLSIIALFCFLSRPGNDRLLALTAWTAQKIAPARSHSSQSAASQTPQTHQRLASSLQSPLPTNKTVLLIHYTLRHRKRLRKTPPKAIWTVETIRTEQFGALYSVWTMPEEGEAQTQEGSEPVVLQPAVLSVPLQSRIITCQAPSDGPFSRTQPLSFLSMSQKAEGSPASTSIDQSIEEKTQP